MSRAMELLKCQVYGKLRIDSFIAKDPCLENFSLFGGLKFLFLEKKKLPRHIFQLRVHGPALVDVR